MIQSDLFARLTLEEAGQKHWRASACRNHGTERHPIRTTNKKATAISKLLLLPAMQLFLVLLIVLAAGAEVQPRRLTRRNSPADQDEEELTIAAGQHFHQAHFGQADVAPAAHQPQQQQRTQKRESEFVDPFAFTFDDYLREASGGRSLSGDSSDENRISQPGTGEAAKLINDDDNEQQQQRTNELHPQPEQPGNRRRLPSLIVEEEDDQRPGSDAGDAQIEGNNNNNRQNQATDAVVAPNEIKLLFSWRALPTNKCSRPCGRGQRLNHLSCVDLKFNVRVESELCERAQLARPSEISDEPCNEHACEPAWHELEYQRECARATDDCRPTGSKLKRLECALVNGAGEIVRLDESRCSSSSSSSSLPASPSSKLGNSAELGTQTTTSNFSQDTEFSIDLNEQIDKERNSILSNEVPMEMLAPSGTGSGHHHPSNRWHQANPERPRSNEPFYGPGEWSECSGASCGQLGRRTRKLACRLYLSRSAKLVDLPESSCVASGARAPDREEPCYMDCGPGGGGIEASASHAQHGPSYSLAVESNATTAGANKSAHHLSPDDRLIQLEDETIYDLEVARYVWRHGGWTKCSAECIGGEHESIVECWDKVAEASVDAPGHCDPLGKPAPLRRACNQVACAPEWRVGPFSECTRRCGSAGVRSRAVACVQRVPLDGDVPRRNAYELAADWTSDEPVQTNLRVAATHEECLGQPWQQVAATVEAPNSIEPCNRHDCRPEWQLGPWSATCSRQCGEGTHNRTVICVQEFANRDGPLALEVNVTHAIVSPDLKEAILLAAPAWHPGKAIQVPLSECYREFHSVPPLSEPCLGHNCTTQIEDEDDVQQQQQQLHLQEEWHIDADPLQDFRIPGPAGGGAMKRKTITLKIGGRAQVLEGRNVKIKCRLVRRRTSGGGLSDLVSRHAPSWGAVEWRLGGVRVFAPNTSVAEKEPLDESPLDETPPDDNSIQADDVLLSLQSGDDKYSMMAADEPPESRRRAPAVRARPGGLRRDRAAKTTTASKARVLSVRSWPTASGDPQQLTGGSSSSSSSFQFVPHPSGRFSLVKENMLRIKRLRPDDSGIYTCSAGPLSESIELTVVGRRGRKMSSPDQQLNNYT